MLKRFFLAFLAPALLIALPVLLQPPCRLGMR